METVKKSKYKSRFADPNLIYYGKVSYSRFGYHDDRAEKEEIRKCNKTLKVIRPPDYNRKAT